MSTTECSVKDDVTRSDRTTKVQKGVLNKGAVPRPRIRILAVPLTNSSLTFKYSA